jgi:hypothetical protein
MFPKCKCKNSIAAVFPIRIRIDFGRLDPDPHPGEQKGPTQIEKSDEI